MNKDDQDEALPEDLPEQILTPQQMEPVSESHHSVEENHRGSFITLTEGESSLPEVSWIPF